MVSKQRLPVMWHFAAPNSILNKFYKRVSLIKLAWVTRVIRSIKKTGMTDLQKGLMFTFKAVGARPVYTLPPVLMPLAIAALVQFHELVYLLPAAPVIVLRHSHDLYRDSDFYRQSGSDQYGVLPLPGYGRAGK